MKEKLEAKTEDFLKHQKEYSTKFEHYDYAKEKIVSLTAEFNTLKNKFYNENFNFKKFDVSSKKIESMIEKQLKFKDNQ